MEQRRAEPGIRFVGQPRRAAASRSRSLLAVIANNAPSASTAPCLSARPSSSIAAWPSNALRRLHAEQARGGVESAAEAGGLRRVEAAREHRRDRAAAGSSPKRRGDLRLAPAARQRRRRHAPRLARGDVAAGQAQRHQMSQALAARAVDAQQLAAPGAAVAAQTHAVEREAEHRIALSRCSAAPRRRARGGAGRRRRPIPSRCASRAAWRVLKKSGCRSCATSCGSTSRIESRCSTASTSAAQVGALSRSPMCCDTKASSPRVTQTVFLKWPPSATTDGPGAGELDRPRRVAAGAADELERRSRAARQRRAARCRRSARRWRGRARAGHRRCRRAV